MIEPLEAVKFHLGQIDGQVHDDFVLLRWEMGDEPPDFGDQFELGEVQFQGKSWPVVAFASELQVRRFLCFERKQHVAFLVSPDWLERIPVDIRDGGFERRVRPVTVRDALGAATGQGWCAAVERQHLRALCEHHFKDLCDKCPKLGQDDLFHKPEVDEEIVLRLLVDVGLGFKAEQSAPAIVLVRAFRGRKRPHPLQDQLSPLVASRLEALYPDDHRILCWCLEDPSRVRKLLVDGARMEAESAVTGMPAPGDLAALRAMCIADASNKDAASQRFVSQVRELAIEALRGLDQSGRDLIAAHRAEIEQTVPPENYNIVLPGALEYRAESLARQALRGSPPSQAEVGELRDHLFAERHATDLEAVGAAVRVARVLEVFPDTAEPVELVLWYASEGALADLTAKRLDVCCHGDCAVGLRGIAQELLDRYWQARDLLNEQFATSLVDRYDEAVFSTELVGVQRIMERQVRPRLDGEERVLLVCIDGCSVPDLCGLMDGLRERGYGLATDGWQAGIALLPSTTEVSRLALFAGQIPEDPIKIGQADAVPAGEQHRRALEKALGKHTGRLFLKRELREGFGALRQAIEDDSLDVVAVVLNSIDDHLGGADVQPRIYDLDDVTHLAAAVEQGCRARRAVIVTADHGHTFHRRNELRRKELGGIAERMVAVPDDGPAPEGVVRFRHPVLEKCMGLRSVGLLHRSGEYASVQPRAGYHGGASLEECVIPCAEIVPSGAPLPRPDWWAGAEAEEPAEAAAEPEPTAGKLVLEIDGRRRALEMPPGLSGREVQALQLLSQQHDRRLSATQLARHLGTRTSRVEGMMADLIQKLNAQGKNWITASAGAEGTEYKLKGGLA